ncbi:hypothetical protein [Aquicoccus sp. SU-CL01552]|uniref:hypothetical protein n=1 Tax=Aquicoccus sp. SU-CL01552 TaxID=3127656 RepID=UPI003103A66E
MPKGSTGSRRAEASGTARRIAEVSEPSLHRIARLRRPLPPHCTPLAPQATLKEIFSASEIEQISMACALFDMVNRLSDDLGPAPESEVITQIPWDAGEVLSVEDFGDFASRIAELGATNHDAPI